MAFSLIILAFLSTISLVELKPAFLMGFSIAALMFAIKDFLEYKANEANDPLKFEFIKKILMFIAVLAFMIIPVIPVPWSESILKKINEFSGLGSIAIVFYIMSLKNEQVASDKLKQIMHDKVIAAVELFKKEELPQLINEATSKENLKAIAREAVKERERELMEQSHR
ncbi:hypothetical protein [Paenibacillus sp. FSL R5-0486]|uniref:hypothetical protein n=1 Tax=Paenibacillus sp. FSL R5-0486 TaxID=2921645 RepID=UPI0030D79CD9